MKESVTIQIEDEVLQATLDYAKRTNTTISALAENYLQFLTGNKSAISDKE